MVNLKKAYQFRKKILEKVKPKLTSDQLEWLEKSLRKELPVSYDELQKYIATLQVIFKSFRRSGYMLAGTKWGKKRLERADFIKEIILALQEIPLGINEGIYR